MTLQRIVMLENFSSCTVYVRLGLLGAFGIIINAPRHCGIEGFGGGSLNQSHIMPTGVSLSLALSADDLVS